MTPLLLPATCLLAVSEVTLSSTDDGWIEVGHHEVVAESRCPWIDVVVPLGSSVQLKGTVRPSDGGKRRIGPLRQEALPPEPGRPERIRLHTPDLLTGDAAWIELTRTLPAVDYTWTPGAQRGRFASLDSTEPFEHGGRSQTSVWFEDADDEHITVAHPAPGVAPVQGPLPDPVAIGRVVQTLNVPGEPQRTLYPGGGSSVHTAWTIELQPGSGSVVVPVPPHADDVEIVGAHTRGWGHVVLHGADGSPEHQVRFTLPDAPTHGTVLRLPGVDLTHVVELEDGRVRWEDERFWWLSSMGMRQLTPEHRTLLRSLDQRFRRAGIPEPAVPVALRGAELSPELVTELRTALRIRAGLAPLPVDPLFPRRLIKARKSGVLTSVENALILTLQLGQLGARATWALVHPGPRELGSLSTPAGYSEGLVAIATEQGVVFVDPGCGPCTGFEVRPHLQGTRLLSPVGSTGPSIVEGASTVTDTDRTRRVQLDGPAALLVRIALTETARDDRTAWLVRRFAGPGGAFVGASGLGTPGSSITLELTLGDAPPDGLRVAGPGWVGDRRWVRTQPADAAHLHADDLCYVSRNQGALRTDVLTVNTPHLDPARWTDFLKEVRAPSPQPPSEPSALEPTPSPPSTPSQDSPPE